MNHSKNDINLSKITQPLNPKNKNRIIGNTLNYLSNMPLISNPPVNTIVVVNVS